MRPVRLCAERFLGLGSVDVSFDCALFVVVGPNGAGKSSLLEALYFALFGKGIRTERGKKELVHRAYPEDPLRVELVFENGGRRYRVVREYSSRRGSAAVLEEEKSEGRIPLCFGERSVNEEIIRITGVDGSTFRSSVFLPQGETLGFVQSTPAERFRVLSSLFGLDVIDRVRDKVKNHLETLEITLRPIFHRMEILEKEALDERVQTLQKERVTVEQEMKKWEQEEEKKQSRILSLIALVDRMKELEETRTLRQEVERKIRQAEKEAREDEGIVRAREICIHYERPWIEASEKAQEAAGEVLRIESIQRETEKEQAALSHELCRSKQDIFRMKREAEIWKQRVGILAENALRLAHTVSQRRQESGILVRRAEEKRKAVENARISLRKEHSEYGKIFKDREEYIGRIEKARKRLEALEEAGCLIRPLGERLREVKKELNRLSAEEKNFETEKGNVDKEASRVEGEIRSVRKRSQELSLLRERIEAKHHEVLGEFARASLRQEWLISGRCPLCGTQVPCPGGDEEEMHDDVLESERVLRRILEEWKAISVSLGSLEEKLSQLKERMSENEKTLVRVGDAITAFRGEGDSLRKQLLGILREAGLDPGIMEKDITGYIELSRSELERIRGKYTECETTLAALKERLAAREESVGISEREEKEILRDAMEACTRVEDAEKRLWAILIEGGWEGEEGDPEEVFQAYRRKCSEEYEKVQSGLEEAAESAARLEERIGSLERRKQELMEELLRRRPVHMEWETKAREKEQHVYGALDKQGWNLKEYRALKERHLLGGRERLEALKGEVSQLEAQMLRIEAEIRKREKRTNREASKVDEEIEKEKEMLTRVRDHTASARYRLGSVENEIRNLESKRQERDALQVEVDRYREEREDHFRLKEALEARGFKRYILAILLKELEREASEFLEELSEGRYRLRVSMEGGTTQVVVVDSHLGGEERFPTECSGGEKTLIALSLALALSRIRLREAGRATHAEFLFIDEGFSTLDREHLELVADAIFRLGHDGTMVGVVTHDTAFANYFPIQLQVSGGKVYWQENFMVR